MTHMQDVLDAIVDAGGRPLFVGGCVRDELLKMSSKDIDIEVYGLPADKLASVLRKFGKVDCVGESFAVIKLTTKNDDFDFSLPRKDNKIGEGHKGFEVQVDHDMTIIEASARRDFTINSMSSICLDENTETFLADPFNGLSDLRNGIIRATSGHFVEDPLRSLRAVQFASRFDFRVEPKTLQMCQDTFKEANSVSVERVYGEMMKWCLKSKKPSRGLRTLLENGWIKLFPELEALVNLPQDPEWHPEGSRTVFRYLNLPVDSSLTCPTHAVSVDNRLSDGHIDSGPIAALTMAPLLASTRLAESSSVNFPIDSFSLTNSAGSFSFDFSSILTPTVKTKSEGFVFGCGTGTLKANKVLRVVTKVPLSCMSGIMNSSIDKFEIFQRVIESASVDMMDMLSGKKFSTQIKRHNDSMDTCSTFDSRPASVHIPIVKVDFTCSTVNSDVIVDFYLGSDIDDWFSHKDSPCKNVLLDDTFDYIIHTNNAIDGNFLEISYQQGDAFWHTALVCDAARDIAVRDNLSDQDRVVLMLAALCHDLGKARTTVMRDDRWRSPGHAAEGVDLTRSLLTRMGFGESVIRQVIPLVFDHMSHIGMEPNDRSVRRMAVRVTPSSIAMLVKLMEADHSGRPPLEKCVPLNASKILLISERLQVTEKKPDPIVKGRHLVAMEMEPGPHFKQILDKCYQAQLDGKFHTLEDGLALV